MLRKFLLGYGIVFILMSFIWNAGVAVVLTFVLGLMLLLGLLDGGSHPRVKYYK